MTFFIFYKKMKQCCIIVPIYREFKGTEEKSLNQLFKIINNFDIICICPEYLDISFLKKYSFYEIKQLEDKNFVNIEAYNHLMLSANFYEMFTDYEFMLIYQLDAWCFRNRLKEWCNKGYDYIGAPWTDGKIGNGGFSLRKISTCIKIMSDKNKLKEWLSKPSGFHNEDGYFSWYGGLNLPQCSEAINFSIETYYNGVDLNELFGCHKLYYWNKDLVNILHCYE